MSEKKCEYQKSDGDTTVAYKADTREYIPVDDITDKVKQISDEHRPRREEKEAFYQERIKLIESATMSADQKSDLLQDLNESVERVKAEDEPQAPPPPPIPGGVGFGTFYTDGALRFNNSSNLYYYIVTPTDIGNNANEWLYLTSTNRSPKGVEAFISFFRQENPRFKVFDWSRSGDDRWTVDMPYSELSDYLLPRQVGAEQYPVIYVVNSTRRLGGTTWRNEVMLYNRVKDKYDRVYKHTYTLAQQDEQKFLTWGPIVETFLPFPNETRRIGFFDATLIQDEQERLLDEDVTELRIDDPGFTVDFHVPNSSFIVH
jgi:hypothetical protein